MAHALTYKPNKVLKPLLWILTQREGAVEHQPHNKQKDWVAPHFMGYNLVNIVGQVASLLSVFVIGLAQCSGDKAILLVCKYGLNILGLV